MSESRDTGHEYSTYRLGSLGGEAYIECLVCHRRSYCPKDISNLYCGLCRDFHRKQCIGDTPPLPHFCQRGHQPIQYQQTGRCPLCVMVELHRSAGETGADGMLKMARTKLLLAQAAEIEKRAANKIDTTAARATGAGADSDASMNAEDERPRPDNYAQKRTEDKDVILAARAVYSAWDSEACVALPRFAALVNDLRDALGGYGPRDTTGAPPLRDSRTTEHAPKLSEVGSESSTPPDAQTDAPQPSPISAQTGEIHNPPGLLRAAKAACAAWREGRERRLVDGFVDADMRALECEISAAQPAGEIPPCDCGWLTRTHSTDCARYKWEHAAAEPAKVNQ